MSLCCHSCPPHNPNTPRVPLAELSGWEEQEGDSTSSIPTSLRSGATAARFPMRIGSVCFSSLVYFLPRALVRYLGAHSQGLASTRSMSQRCHGFARARAEAGAGQAERGQSRAGLLGEGLSPVLSSDLAALLQYAADPQDKHWLTEQQHMRAIGGKMVSTAGHRSHGTGGGGRRTGRAGDTALPGSIPCPQDGRGPEAQLASMGTVVAGGVWCCPGRPS